MEKEIKKKIKEFEETCVHGEVVGKNILNTKSFCNPLQVKEFLEKALEGIAEKATQEEMVRVDMKISKWLHVHVNKCLSQRKNAFKEVCDLRRYLLGNQK